MNPELYFAVMLITNPQKARRILLAEELENWFMDLFDDEYDDVLNGTFAVNQEAYIDRIVDKYLDITDVKMTNTDEYSRSVIDKAFKTASEIQETTWNNILGLKNVKSDDILALKNVDDESLADYIISGIAISSGMFALDKVRKWLSRERANLIALNEANWKWNHEEFFNALSRYKSKIWHTALDERVRATHMVLEGVEIPINEPFHVGNSLMMFATDTSLNADISEIANCRCTTEYKK